MAAMAELIVRSPNTRNLDLRSRIYRDSIKAALLDRSGPFALVRCPFILFA